ncbi:MAG: hypothetical protein Q7R47_02145, partial [Candidatus Diapherotrites archaeon]|nr:hypothetical protein [Candidatus Diapherotrites archaeon]
FGIATLLLLAGCTTFPPSNLPPAQTYSLGEEFTLQRGIPAYVLESPDANLAIRISLWDVNRLGVPRARMETSLVSTMSLPDGAINNMGAIPSQTFSLAAGEQARFGGREEGYRIQLLGIDDDRNALSVRLVVTRATDDSDSSAQVWMQILPVQCGTNAWEIWHRDLNRVYIRAPTEQEILTEWLSTTQQITVLDFAQKPAADGTVVCEACSCGRGDTLAVKVSATDATKLSSLGWTKLGNANGIACTLDAKICPDGTGVGRTEPFCLFAACSQ